MSEPLDYLAVAPCGCIVGWCSASNPRSDIANFVGDMIRRGQDIERVTTDESRTRPWHCATHKQDAATKQEELVL